MRRIALPLVFTLALVLWTAARDASTQESVAEYGVTDLGTLGGARSAALGASEGMELFSGTVGVAEDAAGEEHAFAYQLGEMRDLGTLGGTRSEARASEGGFAAGRAQLPDGRYHAFVTDFYRSTTIQDLGTLGGRESYATAVAPWYSPDGPTVIGASLTAGDATTRAFIYENGVMAPLGASLGGPNSVATGINFNRQIVGYADLPNRIYHAFLFEDGTTTDLGTLGTTSEAFAINQAGVVVGRSRLTSGAQHAFRYAAGSMQDLGTLGGGASEALDVDANGVVVGWAERSAGDQRAFIWRDGVMTDLNTLIRPGTGWVLRAATAIADTGQIVGYGELHGVRRAFALAPAADLAVDLRLHAFDEDTNIPNPHEAGRPLMLGVSIYGRGFNYMASNVVVRDTISGPFEYVSWQSSSGRATCEPSGQQMTCTLREFFGQDTVFIRVRSTSAGSLQHTATIVSADQPDPNPSNDSASESNRAISLSSLTLAKESVVGGGHVLARATLTSPTGAGGSRITLSSSHPNLASVPFPFDVVPFNGDPTWREFYVRTQPVFAPVTVRISATHGLVTRTVPLTILPAGNQWSYRGVPQAIPGIVQVEDFDEGGQGIAYSDRTAGNSGGRYRATDVDLEVSRDAGGGVNAGWVAAGEWVEYTVNVGATGTYRFDARVASPGAGGRFHLELNGANLTGAMTVPNTGGWQAWTTVSRDVFLPAGPQILRLSFDSAGSTGAVGNFNLLQFTAVAPGRTPFGGTPWPVPGTIQAEHFDEGGAGVAYRDTTSGNSGGAYRATDVDIQHTSDAGGGYNVGWMSAGEWLGYTVSVAEAGIYTLTARVASTDNGARFHIEANGVDVSGPLTMPDTGGYQRWQDVLATVTLPAGVQQLRFVCDSSSAVGIFGNLNYIRLVRAGSSTAPAAQHP
jgi:probable HAF family extracellular repeat protein